MDKGVNPMLRNSPGSGLMTCFAACSWRCQTSSTTRQQHNSSYVLVPRAMTAFVLCVSCCSVSENLLF